MGRREARLCRSYWGFRSHRFERRGFTAGHAALKVATCKVTKHENACIENQHMFIPFAFDNFGFLTSETVKLFQQRPTDHAY